MGLLNFLPSACWFFLMLLPFLVQFGTFSPGHRAVQGVGIAVVLATLILSDAVAWRFPPGPILERPRRSRALIGVVIAVFLLQLAHLLAMPRIPLVEKWLHMGARSPDIHLIEVLTNQLFEAQATFLGKLETVRADLPDSWTELPPVIQAHEAALKRIDAQLSQSEAQLPELLPGVPASRVEVVRAYFKIWKEMRENDLIGLKNSLALYANSKDHDATLKEIHFVFTSGHRNDVKVFDGKRYKLEELQSSELQRMREASSKQLNVPAVFIYLCQASLYLAPALALLLVAQRSYALAVGLALFSFVYSRVTLAKGPLYVTVLLYAVIGWQFLSSKTRRRLRVPLGAATGLVLIYAVFFLMTHPLSIFRFKVPAEGQAQSLAKTHGPITFTYSDHFRLMQEYRTKLPGYENTLNLNRVQLGINFLANRAFLTPTEVSQRWYAFYPDVAGGYLGWEGLTPRSRSAPGFQHPANRVGHWAYVSRFPDVFQSSINAYASADADAHARWGWVGLVLLSLALFATRVVLGWGSTGSFANVCFGTTALILLAMGLPQASLLALYVAQGLGVLLMVCVALKIAPILQEGRARNKAAPR